MKKICIMLAIAITFSICAPCVETKAAPKVRALETRSGTIRNAKAYSKSGYVYEGYKNDDDFYGLYYSVNGTDSFIDDNMEIKEITGTDTIDIDDGTKSCCFSMPDGKIIEDYTEYDLQNNAVRRFKSKIRRSDRYKDVLAENMEIDAERIYSEQFEDKYYTYRINDGPIEKFGYIDAEGNYLDCSYDLNLKVCASDGKKSKMVTLENVEDATNANILGEDLISVESLEFLKYIGEDDEYLYSLIKAGIANTSSVADGRKISSEIPHYYIQKVSKYPQEKEKRGFLKPQTTECYEIAPESMFVYAANLECDSDYDLTSIAMGDEKVAEAFNDIISDTEDGAYFGSYKDGKNTYAVRDGKIYAYKEEGSKLYVNEITLNENQKIADPCMPKRFLNCRTATGENCTEQNIAVPKEKDFMAKSWDLDCGGNLWRVRNGKIYKNIKDDDWKLMYICSTDFDCIDVYNEYNIVVWNSEGGTYATVQ